jgi:hypothetical protein
MKLFVPALLAASLSSVMFLISPKGTTVQETKIQAMSAEKENAKEWISLFDGKTKNGWHIFNNGSDGSAWKVVDGMLYLDPSVKVMVKLQVEI